MMGPEMGVALQNYSRPQVVAKGSGWRAVGVEGAGDFLTLAKRMIEGF
ncbi:MAG: hypothetical protein RL077_3219 [Verrucomicrobiota bacterium]|jgi:hypothetical protein